MTNKELSAAIRKKLKDNGITSKDAKVSVKDALYDTSVRVTITNPDIRKTKVEEIVKPFQHIYYDANGMDILAGGNTYVFVQYESGILEEAAASLIPTAEKVLKDKRYDGHAIASNEISEVHLVSWDDAFTLAEFPKSKDEPRAYHPTYWVRSARDLAVAMYRYKVTGTIYA